MRETYHTQLADLGDIAARMCDVAVETMVGANQALLEANLSLAEEAINRDVELDEMRAEAEDSALHLLALQAPVATDLRAVVSALWVVADVQRMGALASHVAKAARRRHPTPVLPEPIQPIFARMGELAIDLGTQAAKVLRERDLGLARALDAQDQWIDALHRELFTELLSSNWTYGVAPAVDISLLGRFYERYADHAVAVGRRVVFLLTGENIGGDTTVPLGPPDR